MTLTLTPEQAAFVCLADHCILCTTCSAKGEEGKNLGLLCPEGERLNEEYRQAQRAWLGP